MKIYYLSFLLLAFQNTNAQLTQKGKLDSMLSRLATSGSDTNKIILLQFISKLYTDSDFDSALWYGRQALALSEKLLYKTGEVFSYRAIGEALRMKGEIDAALDAYQKSLYISRKIVNKKEEAQTLKCLGILEVGRNNDTAALNYLFASLNIGEAMRDYSGFYKLYIAIGSVYTNQKDYKNAGDSYKKAIGYAEKFNDEETLAECYRSLGVYELNLPVTDSAKARHFLNKALRIYEKSGNQLYKAVTYSYLALCQSNLKEAIQECFLAKSMWDDLGPKNIIAINNLGNLGVNYLNIAIYDTLHLIKPGGVIPSSRKEILDLADKYLYTALTLAKETDDMTMYSNYVNYYGEVQAQKGNYKVALEYERRAGELMDSMYSQDIKNQIASVIGERELALRDKEIALNKLSISASHRQRLALTIGIGLLAVIGGLLYWQSRTRKHNNTTLLKLNSELDDANKLKAKFFAILSHDFRGPVASLVSFLEMQEHEPAMLSAEQKAEHQKKISHSTRALLETMESMLLWSKGQMENFKPEIKQVRVLELFEHIRNFFSGIENVNLNFSDPGTMMVSTDENYLQTIMHNLTSNSIKILKETPGATIAWKAVQKGNETVLSITDNGPGLGREQSKSILSDVMMQNEKTGFGFHMIRDLAKAIKCRISLETSSETGTTFLLII